MSHGTRQLGLSLPQPRRWGGQRKGAGRKPVGEKAGMPHVSRKSFTKVLPAHVTVRLRSDLPSLRIGKLVRLLERTFAVGCERPDFRLVHYSLLRNHVHMIVEAHDHDALGRGMRALGIRIARAVNRVADRKGRVLADRYHLQLLPTPRQVRNALRYVLLNARRHARTAGAKLAGPARLDPASSARWFDGWKKRGRESEDSQRPSVARAKTWLLRVGWRRWGLLDPAAVPG